VGDDDEVGLMPEFIPAPGGSARLILDREETDVIRQLTGEMRALISAPLDPSDSVYERLFPRALEDDAEEAKYRDLIGDELVKHKLEALDAVSTALGSRGTDVTLEGEALHQWLSCLTDMRLAIGTRLDVDEDRMSAAFDTRDPDSAALAVLHWLGWIQDGVIQACSG
jgi:hypothetical protein